MTRDQIKALIEEHIYAWCDDTFSKHGVDGVDEAADAIFKALTEAPALSSKDGTGGAA